MINFREIFNPNYTIIGLIIIIALIILIFVFNKDTKQSLNLLGKTAIITSIITFLISLILKLGIDILIPYNYKLLIQVISNNLLKSYINSSILILIIGIILFIFSKLKQPK